MPDNDEMRSGADKALPVAVEAKKPEPEKVGKPETALERSKRRNDAALKENDDQRSARRAKELATHLEVHQANVAAAHEKWPTGEHTWGDWNHKDDDQRDMIRQHFGNQQDNQIAEQKRWNEKRNDIDMANKAYNLAVKRSLAEHRDEDRHVASHIAAKFRAAHDAA